MKYIYDLHKTMLKQDLILVYEGEFTQEITKSVLSMAERNMDSFGEQSSVKRKVFNVMVECLQNISRHAENFEEGDTQAKNNAIFMIGKRDTEYVISSGNAIVTEKVPIITERLHKINSLDKDGLKEYYKHVIRTTKINEETGGAGLGFIDMARKSGRNLVFDFEEINEKLTFFSLKMTIPRTKK